jgi:HNH endonuclease
MINPIPEKLTKMIRRHSYRREMDRSGADGCIYCNERPPPPLTVEHIIPESLGGMLTIEGASCAQCSGQTHAFEGHACRAVLPVRRQMGFPRKQRGAKDRIRRKAERFVLMLDRNRVKVPIDDFPALLMSLVFPFPGILLGQQPDDKPLSGGVYSAELMEGFGEKLNRIKAKYRANSVGIMGIEPTGRGAEDDYGRMLAKIAHSYAAAELGCGNFDPFLVHVIRGVKPYYLPYFIGSISDFGGSKALSDDLHEISLDHNFPSAEPYIIVRLRLFANRNTPTHLIVVGRRI